ncbi:two-component system sensor histidine kinase/response regulator [Burkholderia lata]|uniref:hypothetical protein n=1 Tax=Burkholderia lata (strain ATCC 17760 / DSM 23089 / LMG 22485 / NCIMB 9086 / R18194 / 383) TaxID=482957 RepID=UPI0014542CDE|nr:hypothetical protein [Burkholderia lata]VWC77309.1 two-component system sensor histidine kinase/response regulator [Burkholderia lata]
MKRKRFSVEQIVPVIAMTAHATDEDLRRSAQVGAAEVVLKPLSLSALDEVLRRHAARGVGVKTVSEERDSAPLMSGEIRDTLRAATLHSLAAIDAALANSDAEAIRIEFHSMRGGFALAGDVDARDACADKEAAVNAGGVGAVKAGWADFQGAIVLALERLRH